MNLKEEDHIITSFLQTIGPWRKFVVIGGGYAPIIYKLYLSDKSIKNPPVGTRDIDSLVPRKIPKISEKNLANHLEESGFQKNYKDHNIPATESYIKEINDLEIEIEFLTHDSTRKEKTENINVSGVSAQPLRYLKLSLDKTIPFYTFSGEDGMVVSPDAWIFHKGLTFNRRKSESKKLKDLYGIWYVATQLDSFSEKAIFDFHKLSTLYPKWFRTFQLNLTNWVDNATPFDWSKLEMQDPNGCLKKAFFNRAIKELIKNQRQ